MASQVSAVDSVKELPMDAQGMMQTMAAIQLYQAQREVAHYFELAYLKLGDMPDVAREVRETANNARTQHLMTSGLMKKFTLTAGHIVSTMIPMILDAVELEDKDIIVDCFAQILNMAEDMKKEAEDTQQRYHVIQSQVQSNMAKLVEKNKEVLDEEQKRAIEMERQKDLLKAAQMKEKQLEEEKQKMKKEFEDLQKYRDKMAEESVKAVQKEGEADNNTFLDAAIAPGVALGGGMEAVMEVIKTGVNIFKSVFGGNKIKSTQKAFKDSQAKVENMLDKNLKVIDQIHQERTNALDRLATIRELAMADVGIGNAESLREASAHLGDVDKQFTRLIQFWSNMAAVLKYLKDDTKAGEVYLKKIENQKYADRFKKSISRSEKGWTNFGRICQDYIVESDSEIGNLYAFLSAPIDQMPAGKRKERVKELMQKIEDDIDNIYPEEQST